MWKARFLKQVDLVTTLSVGFAFPDARRLAERGRRPFPHAVDGENGGFLEWAGEKSAGGVAHVMIAEEDAVILNVQSFWISALDLQSLSLSQLSMASRQTSPDCGKG